MEPNSEGFFFIFVFSFYIGVLFGTWCLIMPSPKYRQKIAMYQAMHLLWDKHPRPDKPILARFYMCSTLHTNLPRKI